VDWIGPAECRDKWRALAKAVMNLRVPYNAGKFLSSRTTGCLSRRGQILELVCLVSYLRCYTWEGGLYER
jgi:hypothetical protein